MNGGQLQFADFSNAQLQGASFEHAHLQGAILRNADLSSANLGRARLHGADMTGTILSGADLRRSGVWMTLPPEIDNVKLADMSNIQIKPLSDIDRETLEGTLKSMSNDKLRSQVADSVKGVLSEGMSEAWADSDEIMRWRGLVTIARPDNTLDYQADLTTFLETLACQSRWMRGSVAEGIVRRASQRQFLGDQPALYLRLTTDEECRPAKHVSASVMQSLASIVSTSTSQISQ